MNLQNLRLLREHKPPSDLEMLILLFAFFPCSLPNPHIKNLGGTMCAADTNLSKRLFLVLSLLVFQSLADPHPKVLPFLLMVAYSFTHFALGKLEEGRSTVSLPTTDLSSIQLSKIFFSPSFCNIVTFYAYLNTSEPSFLWAFHS